jgi:hypothetical protein
VENRGIDRTTAKWYNLYMEKLFPNGNDFAPALKQASDLIKQIADLTQHLGEAIRTINTGMYLNGFLTGVTITATLLTAIWAFSRKQ